MYEFLFDILGKNTYFIDAMGFVQEQNTSCEEDAKENY